MNTEPIVKNMAYKQLKAHQSHGAYPKYAASKLVDILQNKPDQLAIAKELDARCQYAKLSWRFNADNKIVFRRMDHAY